MCSLFTPLHLESCTWPNVISWWIQQLNSKCTSNHFRRCNLLVQDYYWWRELDLQLWPWDKATIAPLEKSKITETENGERDDEQSQELAHSFIWHQQGLLTKNLSWQTSQFHMLLLCHTATVRKCEDFAPNVTWLLHHYDGASHTSISTREFLSKNNMTVISIHPTETYLRFPKWR
jgi:hypothetical protein